MRELGRVCSEDLDAKLLQFFLGERQPHIKNFEHLEFHLSNVPATEDAGGVRPVTVTVRGLDGILDQRTRISTAAVNHGRTRNAANLCGEDQSAHKQLMQDPFHSGNNQMALRPLQIEQSDEDGRCTCLAPPDDIRHELCEATVLFVHPVGQSEETRARLFGRFEFESVSSHICGRVCDVVCDADVSRVI